MGSHCSNCQVPNQQILSDTLSLDQKYSRVDYINPFQTQIHQINLKEVQQNQNIPKKQYTGEGHPTIELKFFNDEEEIDDFDNLVSPTLIYREDDKVLEQESKKNCSNFSSQRSISLSQNNSNNITSDGPQIVTKLILAQQLQTKDQLRKKKSDFHFTSQIKKLNNEEIKKKKQVTRDSSRIRQYEFYKKKETDPFFKKLFGEKISLSQRTISILKKPQNRKFHSMTPIRKRVRFAFDNDFI